MAKKLQKQQIHERHDRCTDCDGKGVFVSFTGTTPGVPCDRCKTTGLILAQVDKNYTIEVLVDVPDVEAE